MKPNSWLPPICTAFALGMGILFFQTLEGCGPVQCINGVCKEAVADSGPKDAAPVIERVQDGIAPRKPAAQLIDNSKWTIVPAAQDPFQKYKKSTSKCEEAQGRKVEDGVLEIDTDFCNYITLQQPSLTEIRAGELIEFVMWHLELYAPTKGTGYVALMINGELVWENKVNIPGKAQFYEPTWSPQAPIPKGATVMIHLHNHGANTWKFHSITTGEPF